MSKQTLSVTVNGKTYSRTTGRNYTHAVYLEGMASVHGGSPFCMTGVHTWCGSEALAEKTARRAVGYYKGVTARVVEVAP